MKSERTEGKFENFMTSSSLGFSTSQFRKLLLLIFSRSHEYKQRLLEKTEKSSEERARIASILWMIFHVLLDVIENFLGVFFLLEDFSPLFRAGRIDEWRFRFLLMPPISWWVHYIDGNFAQLITFVDKIQFHKHNLSLFNTKKCKKVIERNWIETSSRVRVCIVNEIDYAIRQRFFTVVWFNDKRKALFSGLFPSLASIWWLATELSDLIMTPADEIKSFSFCKLTCIDVEVWWMVGRFCDNEK